MDAMTVIRDLYGRIPTAVAAALDGLRDADLAAAPGAANPLGWLIWHLSRVTDQQIAELSGREQVWVWGGWAPRFGLPRGATDTGYGHTREQVLSVRPRAVATLRDYYDAVRRASEEYLASLRSADLDRIVDESFEPPVTCGARLVSIAEDCSAHVGQAAYVRGLLPVPQTEQGATVARHVPTRAELVE
jgi:hypothetical protein